MTVDPAEENITIPSQAANERHAMVESVIAMATPQKPAGYTPVPTEVPTVLSERQAIPTSRNTTGNGQETKASWFRIYSLCIANFGINCAWALEFAITTPYFEKSLKAGKLISHAVWIVGPLSGLIVAPIVGTLSDRCTSRFGRRRPFIFAGIIATVVGMLMFSNALQLANLFISPESESNRIVAIGIAIFSFCILDLALNTTMWPVRALQGDLIPKHQQHCIQSASIVMFSIGDLCANGLLNASQEPVSQIRVCFFVVAILYAISVSSLLVLGKESSLRTDDPSLQTDNSQSSHSFNIFSYLRSLPPWMWRIGITHALGFFALFCFLPNTSTWVGATVLGGDPSAPPKSAKARLYEEGVTLYGRASLVRSIIQIVYSAVYPYILYVLTPAQLMSVSFATFSIVMLMFANTHTRLLGQIVIFSMALPIGAHFTLPVGLTVEHSEVSNRGKYLGALNCFAVVPQLIDTAYTGFISRAFGEVMVMRIGAIWAMLTATFAFFYMYVN